MRQYVRGDRIEVLKTNGTLLEESCHPARIVGGNGDVYTVLYDRHANGVVAERMSMRCIRPRPPLVEFSDWSHVDLVQVFDSFAWQSAAVLRVSEEKLFRVRVLGSTQDR
uniref:Agenet-like domain-containing protein n=1 Tax=Kalanchoe fedtschenkoi TaxID=63787 RepID=A0A7N0TEH9_KALFE